MRELSLFTGAGGGEVPMNPGDIIKTSYGQEIYQITAIDFCDDAGCNVYQYSEVPHTPHYHLTLMDAGHKGTRWINGVRSDLTTIHGDRITILVKSQFLPAPQKDTESQMELFK